MRPRQSEQDDFERVRSLTMFSDVCIKNFASLL